SGAAGALLRSVSRTQSQTLEHVHGVRVAHGGDYVVLDPVTRRNLAITDTISGEDGPTLFSILDHCATPMGSRLLRRWLHHPLRSNAPVLARQSVISTLLSPPPADGLDAEDPLDQLRAALRDMPDLERIATRMSLRSVRPRELASLRDCLHQLPQFTRFISGRYPDGMALQRLNAALEPDPAAPDLPKPAMADEPADQIRDAAVLSRREDAAT